MRQRLDYLFDSDIQTRWRVIVVSTVAIAVSGFIAEAAGAKVKEAQVAATILGVTVFCIQVLIYTVGRHVKAALQTRQIPLLRSGVAVAATAILAIFASVFGPGVQAAVLNRRLRTALELHQAIPRAGANRTSEIVWYATQAHLTLHPTLVATALHEFGVGKTPDAWKAYVTLVTYTVNLRANRGDLELMRDSSPDLAVLSNAPLCGPTNEALMIGTIPIKNGNIKSVESLKQWPHGIHNCRLSLDGRPLQDAFIFDTQVEYRGGPLTLRNVRFMDVAFDLDENDNTRKFAEALLHADNAVVTLTLP